MKSLGTLIAVKDMEKSKQFYNDVLGLTVVNDFGANVELTGGIFLQTVETWKYFILKRRANDVVFGNHASELCFEADDIDSFAKKLESFYIFYVHRLIEHDWGQKVIRFYDPDNHIIEVGENIIAVIKRFIKSGLSIEETAQRMDVSVDYIKSRLGL